MKNANSATLRRLKSKRHIPFCKFEQTANSV